MGTSTLDVVSAPLVGSKSLALTVSAVTLLVTMSGALSMVGKTKLFCVAPPSKNTATMAV